MSAIDYLLRVLNFYYNAHKKKQIVFFDYHLGKSEKPFLK